MTYTPEKLLQLEFMVKTITQCRKVEDDNHGMAINVQFLNHPEQRVCEIPKTVPEKECTTSVTAVNMGKMYTFAVPDSGGSCSPKPVSLSVRLYSLHRADVHSGDPELASGELVVKTTTLADFNLRLNTDDKYDMTVPMTDCQGRTVVVLTVLVRAWIAGTVTTSPIDSPPLCPSPLSRPASTDSCSRAKSSEYCSSSLDAQEPIPCCSCKPIQKPRPCCRCKIIREPRPCCNKPAPVGEPTFCCKKPSPPSYCHRCIKIYSGMDRIERNVIDQPHRQYVDVGHEINDRKMDLSVRKMHCYPCSAQRRIAHEADKFISKVTDVVKYMHGFVNKDMANIVD